MFTVEQYEIDMYKCGQHSECYEGITVAIIVFSVLISRFIIYAESIFTTYNCT